LKTPDKKLNFCFQAVTVVSEHTKEIA